MFLDKTLRSSILDFLKKHPELYAENEVSMPYNHWMKLKEIIGKEDLNVFKNFHKEDSRYLTMTPAETQALGLTSPSTTLPEGGPQSWILATTNLDMLNYLRSVKGEKPIDNMADLYPEAKANQGFLGAISNGDLTSAYEMLSNKTVDLNAFDNFDQNALMISIRRLADVQDDVRQQYMNFIQHLLDSGIALSSDSYGRTETALATQLGELDVLKLLLEHDDSNILCTDKGGKNLLHVLAYCPQAQIVELLLSYPQLKDEINAKDCNGQTPLYALFNNRRYRGGPLDSYQKSADYTSTFVSCCDLFINAGANPNIPDYYNRLPLTVCGNHYRIIETLLEQGQFDSDQLYEIYSHTDAVHSASKFVLFVEYGMEKIPQHALECALHHGECELASALIFAGAPVNDREYHTSPLFLAIHKSRSPSLVKLLLKHGAHLRPQENVDAGIFSWLTDSLHEEIMATKIVAPQQNVSNEYQQPSDGRVFIEGSQSMFSRNRNNEGSKSDRQSYQDNEKKCLLQ